MIVGTAGHIDHGKTALVKALTGVEGDRLKEEKARGITIDLGFAYLPLESGDVLGFVDAPGHERFVHTMAAGAAGIDFALLAIAADDGVMPQTREHIAILDLLGVARGVAVITKADLATPERLAAFEGEIRLALADTGLRDIEIVAVSAATGHGVDALRARLVRAAAEPSGRPTDGRFRLAIDRSFTLPGIGLVVTGIALSGVVRVGDTLAISPSGAAARVRSLHAQNRASAEGRAGERCALNLSGAGLSKDAIKRGDMALDPELHAPTDRIDARLRLLPSEANWKSIAAQLGGEARFRPPRTRDIATALGWPERDVRPLLKLASRLGRADEVAPDHFFLRATVREMVGIAADVAKSGLFTAAQFRDRLGNGRKVAIQILEFFDACGVTLRRGEMRRVDPLRLDLFGPLVFAGPVASGGETFPLGRSDFKSEGAARPFRVRSTPTLFRQLHQGGDLESSRASDGFRRMDGADVPPRRFIHDADRAGGDRRNQRDAAAVVISARHRRRDAMAGSGAALRRLRRDMGRSRGVPGRSRRLGCRPDRQAAARGADAPYRAGSHDPQPRRVLQPARPPTEAGGDR